MNIYGQSVSSTAAAMYSVLCSLSKTSERTGHRDSRGVYVYASRRQLGQYIERSERTAQRVVSELKAAGLIWVRRMGLHSHDRIYLVSVGGSDPVKNGGSEIMKKSIKRIADISILQHKTQTEDAEMAANAADDAKIAVPTARIAAPAAKKMQDSEQSSGKKDKATPKRRQRITKATKEAAKAEYKKLLWRKLDMSNDNWLAPGLEDEYQRTESLIDLIAEAVSVKGRQIRVNGAGLTVQQYWNVVQNISIDAINGLFDRLKTAAVCTGITNVRAYTLAAVYNAIQWHSLTASADIAV